jgi:hypothetical protein
VEVLGEGHHCGGGQRNLFHLRECIWQLYVHDEYFSLIFSQYAPRRVGIHEGLTAIWIQPLQLIGLWTQWEIP